MDKDNIEGVGIMWRRDGGQYHLPTLDRRQEDHDREKMIIILTLIEKKSHTDYYPDDDYGSYDDRIFKP